MENFLKINKRVYPSIWDLRVHIKKQMPSDGVETLEEFHYHLLYWPDKVMNTKESALSVKIVIFKFILWANPHEMDNNWEEICSEKYYKKGSQSTREA